MSIRGTAITRGENNISIEVIVFPEHKSSGTKAQLSKVPAGKTSLICQLSWPTLIWWNKEQERHEPGGKCWRRAELKWVLLQTSLPSLLLFLAAHDSTICLRVSHCTPRAISPQIPRADVGLGLLQIPQEPLGAEQGWVRAPHQHCPSAPEVGAKSKHFKGKTNHRQNTNTSSGSKKTPASCLERQRWLQEEVPRTQELIFSTFYLLPEYLWCLPTGRAADPEAEVKPSAPGCSSNKKQEHSSTHPLEISPHTTTQFSLFFTTNFIFPIKPKARQSPDGAGRTSPGSGPAYLTSASGLLSWLLGIQFSMKSLCVLGLLLAHFCFFSFLEDEEGMLPLLALWLRGEEFTTPLTFL